MNVFHLLQSRLKTSPYLAFYGFLLFFLVYTMAETKPYFDDFYQITTWNESSGILDVMKKSFSGWSSRIVIDTSMAAVIGTSFRLWQVINVAMVGLLLSSLASLFLRQPSRTACLALTATVLTYPYHDLNSAGWATTTMVYLWPVCLAAFACTYLKKLAKGSPVYPWLYPLYTLALLYAANLEFILVALLPLYLAMAVREGLAGRRPPFLYFQIFLLFLALALSLGTPGNQIRFAAETVLRFPDFTLLNVIDRLQIGYSSSLYPFTGRFNPTWFVFSLLLVLAVLRQTDDLRARILAVIPLAACVIPWQAPLLEAPTWYGILDINRISSGGVRLEFFLLGFIYLCAMFAALFAFADRTRGWLAWYALGAGLVTRLIMSFSPTLWASGDRTFIVMYFGVICAALLLLDELAVTGFTIGAKKAAKAE